MPIEVAYIFTDIGGFVSIILNFRTLCDEYTDNIQNYSKVIECFASYSKLLIDVAF